MLYMLYMLLYIKQNFFQFHFWWLSAAYTTALRSSSHTDSKFCFVQTSLPSEVQPCPWVSKAIDATLQSK